jgi:DNA-binding response OmpR family regulator
MHVMRPCILIVEETHALLGLFSKAFELAGFEVLKSTNPFNAYYLLEEGGIDVLLTELDMAGKTSGAVLAREVARQWPNIRILAVSRSEPSADELPMQAHFLAKPFSTAELVAKVSSVLNRKIP